MNLFYKLLKLCTFCILFFITPTFNVNNAQSYNNVSLSKIKIKQVSRPEKIWAIIHPFVFTKAVRITNHVLQVTDSIIKLPVLDGDADGGQVDAFRHGYWMAMLAAYIGQNKALSLGKAHERANYLEFKKKTKKKLSSLHDKASTDMDLYNNVVGVNIGEKMKNYNCIEIQNAVIDSILKGEMKIINKNSQNQSLDEYNNIIENDKIQFHWITPRCLVPS
ncbi:MAG TPA: hypothetical protein P5250_06530, partial [Bacteroidales bacterium]|nr:hypothetical protein [Bacteroidales bacterium]